MITTNIKQTLELHFPGIDYIGIRDKTYKLFNNQKILDIHITVPDSNNYYYKLEVYYLGDKIVIMTDTDIDYLLVRFKDSLHKLSSFYSSLYL